MWFSTDNGLFRLDPFTLEPEVFDERHGLHETEFNRTGHHLGTSGTAYFSTINGLVRFSTTDFPETDRETPPLVITRLMQHNQSTGTVEDVLAEFQKNNQLFLSAEDDFVSVKFTLLDFSDAPQFFRYRTTTDQRNLPSEWFTIEEPEINLNGLPAGMTRLEIQSRIRGVGWPEKGLVIPISVAAPWYANPLNILYLAVLLGLSVGLLVLTRVRILRSRNAQLEQMVEDRTKDLQTSLDLQETYLQEVHHRVKNNLQIINSILNLQKKFVQDKNAIVGLEEIQNRVSTMSIIHETLYQNTAVSNIGFPSYLTRIAGNIIQGYQSQTRVELVTDLDDVQAPLDQAIPCGLILNEWVSNAMKYAFEGRESGTISVGLKAVDVEGKPEEEEIQIEVKDDGVGLPEGFDWSGRDSLGLYLVQALSEQLDAELLAESDGGTRFLVSFRRPKNLFDG